VASLDVGSRDGLARVGDELLTDARALPRAYVLPQVQGFSPARHPGLTATQLVASPDTDVHRMALIENDPNVPTEPTGSAPAVAATRVDDLGPNSVRVVATADGPSYLILADFYHRGWTAHVDGQSARVLIANALYRAVAIDAGTHVVDFRFEPLSVLLGALVSIVSLIVALAAILLGFFWKPRSSSRPRR
jgi:hypothetical protein